MVFSTLTLLFFFLPVTIAGYFALPWRAWRNLWLLGVSLFFYAWGEPVYIALLVASVVANWSCALGVQRGRPMARTILVASVALNLAAIGVFKYADFIVENVNRWTSFDVALPGLGLPIGISFYTFQAISYLVDVHRGTVRAQSNPIYLGTYLAMFPQLIAGPIVRYATIEAEIRSRRETFDDVHAGLRRFAIGLAKKVILADTMAQIAGPIFAGDPAMGAIPAWFGIFAYTFQIYFDFSGYSDMAIGLGRIFGFHYLENFNYPYIARSVTGFWRRWHISLSTFFRDYVYVPMGGNRAGVSRWILSLLVVWALTGLWHGARWNYVCWGAYFGALLIGEKLLWGRLLERLPGVVQHGYTIAAFVLSWVIFRLEDFDRLGGWFTALFGGHGAGHPSMLNALSTLHLWPWLVIGAIGSTPLFGRWLASLGERSGVKWIVDAWVLVVYVWSVLILVVEGHSPFIYLRF